MNAPNPHHPEGYQQLSFPLREWESIPRFAQVYILFLQDKNTQLGSQVEALKIRVEELESRTKRTSHNSNQPPAADSPFKRAAREKKKPEEKKKPGGKTGHAGHRQVMLEPTKIVDVFPEPCTCGASDISISEPFYTHQVIELPTIPLDVTHFVLRQEPCLNCGKVNKAVIPQEHQTGFGPRLTAFIGEMAGVHGNSRRSIKDMCKSVLGLSISLGAIQNAIDRVSDAIKPHYEAIAQKARTSAVNYIDETSWFLNGVLMWLWVMTNSSVALFMIHPNRSKEAFAALIGDWGGILVSDGYRLYQKWVNLRQTCLAHLIRRAKALAESKDPEMAACGRWAEKELQLLCHFATEQPNVGKWGAFYARLSRLIKRYHDRKDEAGKFTRHLLREMDSLWVFLEVAGVDPTNNHAERTLRFGVQLRKRSQGTASEKGNLWVGRILSFRQTCRIRKIPTFSLLVDAVEAYFKGQKPDTSWI